MSEEARGGATGEPPEGTLGGTQEPPVRITDKRKIDRAADAANAGVEEDTASSPAPRPGDEEVASLKADLQRVAAEYANYRKRAERDRVAAGDLAIARVLADFLPVLDNLDRAREHGDLTGGLKAVAEQLDDVFAKLGLSRFGEVGDPFDPAVHEAVMHTEDDSVSVATCTTIMRPGYRHGERLLRPAMVAVTEPGAPAAAEPQSD